MHAFGFLLSSSDMDVDMAALRKVAEAATPGPWAHDTYCDLQGHQHSLTVKAKNLPPGSNWYTFFTNHDDAVFVAAFNPETALLLLDLLDAKDRELGWARTIYDAQYRELAEAEYERHDVMSAADMQCRRYQAKLEAVRALHERVDTNEGSCCNVCRETAHTWYKWPCPTIRALGDEGE